MLRRKNRYMPLSLKPKREPEMKRKTGWRTEVARGADGEMYQPVETGLQVSVLETSITVQTMETELVVVTLSTPASGILVVVMALVVVLSGMSVVAVVVLTPRRLAEPVESVDITKVL
jgi:hypothetical protein